MNLERRPITANDNAPEPWVTSDLSQVKHRSSGLKNRGSFHHLATTDHRYASQQTKGFRSGFMPPNGFIRSDRLDSETFNAGFETVALSGLIISLFAFVAALYAFPTLILGAAGAVIVFSTLALARIKTGWRARELTALTAWLAVSSVGIVTLSSINGIALLAGSTGLIVSYLTQTRLTAILGILSLLCLAWVFSPFFISTESLNPTQSALLTATIFGFIGLAGRLSSRSVLFLAFSVLSVWCAVWLSTSELSAKAVAAFVFITSAAFYKLGKAALDEDAFGALFFICYGWVIGFSAFLYFQHSYLTSEAHILSSIGKSANESNAWIVGVCCALACIFASGLSRHKHNRQNVFSLLLTTLALGTVPFLLLRPESVAPIFDSTPGLSMVPSLGLILATFGFMIALTLTLNGLRLRRNLYLILGLAGLGAQISLLFKPSLFTLDTAVIILVSLVCAASLISLMTPSKT